MCVDQPRLVLQNKFNLPIILFHYLASVNPKSEVRLSSLEGGYHLEVGLGVGTKF